MKKSYFSRIEIGLWCFSVLGIVISCFLFDKNNFFTPAVSILGVTSLILNAKGNPVGQFLMIVFSLCYGWISLQCAYYGEMITYLGMTAPMALVALIAWLRHPYQGNRTEVAVNQLHRKEICFSLCLTVIVTVIFYWILKALSTQNLFWSTLSVATSFFAVYLTARRSPYFALAYAANDIVLIVLWILAMKQDVSCLSVVICFGMFLLNDIYGFLSWRSMQKRQQ